MYIRIWRCEEKKTILLITYLVSVQYISTPTHATSTNILHGRPSGLTKLTGWEKKKKVLIY